ncbi:MAG: hypothetical protein ACRC0V_09770 [Fusobacteriaceae bacterium]
MNLAKIVVEKAIEIFGDTLDPTKKLELEKAIMEAESREAESRSKSLSMLFEKGGFPALMWGLTICFVSGYFYSMFTGNSAPEIPKIITDMITYTFLGILGKKGFENVKGVKK